VRPGCRLLVGLFFMAALFWAGVDRAVAADPAGMDVVTEPAASTIDNFDAEFEAAFGEHDAVPGVLISDPFEPVNRGIFWVNDKFYFYLFKPVARGYRFLVPQPARTSVGNFLHNVATPIRVANALLQFKFKDVGTELYRFIVNSTAGIGGLFDPAKSIAGVKPCNEDFGQTLGFYRLGHGFYLVLPVVGPSSLRDAVGSFVDAYADPFHYVGLSEVEYVSVKGGEVVNRLSLDRDTYEGIVRDSLDPYLFIRNAYAQRRKAQVGEQAFNMNILSEPLFHDEMFNPLELLGF